MLGIVAGVASASLLLAYGVLGFAVLHAITRGMNMRWLVLGLRLRRRDSDRLAVCWRSACSASADAVVGVRGRFARKGGPLPPSST